MQSAAQPQFSKRYQLVTEEKAGGATYTPCSLPTLLPTRLSAAHGSKRQISFECLIPLSAMASYF